MARAVARIDSGVTLERSRYSPGLTFSSSTPSESEPTAWRELTHLHRKLDVEAHEIALLRDDHDRAGVRRVNGAPSTDIGEIGDGDSVEYSPNVVCMKNRRSVRATEERKGEKLRTGLLANHLDAEGATSPRMSSVATNDILGRDDLLLDCLLLLLAARRTRASALHLNPSSAEGTH